MCKKDLKEKLQTMESDQLFKWLSWILVFAGSVTLIVFVSYFMHFNNGFSPKQEEWGLFGDFIGGILNPILSFMALISLLLTVVLQSKQLELSRQELSATRIELERSATAQEQTQKAQIKQARALEVSSRISAITKLLEQNKEELKEQKLHTTESMETIDSKTKPFEDNKKKLRDDLGKLYAELVSMDGVSP